MNSVPVPGETGSVSAVAAGDPLRAVGPPARIGPTAGDDGAAASEPAPADAGAAAGVSVVANSAASAAWMKNSRDRIARRTSTLLGKHDVDLPPVLLGGRALLRPVGRVVEHVGHVGRPEAADMTVEQIALDRLAESGRPAGTIGFPSGREDE